MICGACPKSYRYSGGTRAIFDRIARVERLVSVPSLLSIFLCSGSDCKLVSSEHLGSNHHCKPEKLSSDGEFGQLWRHYAFRIYRHEPDRRTNRIESYIPFRTCNDLSENYSRTIEHLLRKYPKLGSLLSGKNETRLCVAEDEILLDQELIRQPDIIAFHTGHRILRTRGYLNRLLMLQLLPETQRDLVYRARELPLYKFTQLYSQHIENLHLLAEGDQMAIFWELCRRSEFREIRIREFLLTEHDLVRNSPETEQVASLSSFF
jgi:hypothetical protein